MRDDDFLIIAGKGEYPRRILEGARKAGVGRIGVLAFRGQTSSSLLSLADVSVRFGVGEIGKIRKWIEDSGFRRCLLAGQITPAALFATRFDKEAAELLSSLAVKSAHTIFGAVLDRLASLGIEILPASLYMDEATCPNPGVLTRRQPSEGELRDIERGYAAAMAIGKVDIGQTVVVKDGMVLAVEAFEGTDRTIRRGGKLGGRGSVVVKIAREGHDMRFDIPVIGHGTIRRMSRSGSTAIAFQAGRAILLDREGLVAEADKRGIAIVAIDSGLPPAPLRP